MRSPILTFEGNDLMVFRSVAAAEAFVEPPDIAVFETYDADGRLLAFETDGRRTFLREQESSPSHGWQLREALLRVLAAAGAPADPSASLDDLIKEAAARFQR